nr:hypothetical protein [uncultured Noviherbaspirillum sp.]
MRELAVGTQTTPVELAELFNGLSPDDIVGGKPGADGAVVLFGSYGGLVTLNPASNRAVIAARVAIDVVLQRVEGMPGAQALVGRVRRQLDGDVVARVGGLAAPLTLLAELYCKTVSPMPGSPAQSRLAPRPACHGSDDDDTEQLAVTPEQQQALKTLIDRLMQLPTRSKQPDRQ